MSTFTTTTGGRTSPKLPLLPMSLQSYSPISTLSDQYSSLNNNRILIFVRTNANCCYPGGVETLLKLNHHHHHDHHHDNNNNMTQSTTTTAVSSSDDPFSFLNDNTDTSSSSSAAGGQVEMKKKKTKSSTITSTATSNISGFLKSVAKKTSTHLERSMTELAIRADQGRNPDVLVVALVDATTGTLLSRTEDQPLPTVDQQRLQGCWFAIPLVLRTTPTMTTTTNNVLQLRLYLKSGAAMLKSKFHCLGHVTLNVAQLQTSLSTKVSSSPSSGGEQPPSPPPPQTFMLKKQLESQVVVDGQLHLCVTTDLKFPSIFGRGWSMTDADTSGYTLGGLYHLPLDQSYGYSIIGQKRGWFIATERAIESTIVLPIASAVAQLCHHASQVSISHATSVCSQLRDTRHDDTLNVPTGKAQVMLQVGALQIIQTTKTTTSHHKEQQQQQQQAALSIHWQRPDSIFEVELIHEAPVPMVVVGASPTIPGTTTTTATSTFQASTTLPFAPPIVTTNKILPSILTMYGTNNTPPPPYLLGNLRLQFRVMSASSSTTQGMLSSMSADHFDAPPFVPDEETWHAILPLEPYVNHHSAANSPVQQIPIYHSTSGRIVGTLGVQLTVSLNPATIDATKSIVPSAGGLISIMGLDTLMEDNGSLPILDFDLQQRPPSSDETLQRRQQQLQTMGFFVSHQYLQRHVMATRTNDTNLIAKRAKAYQTALSFNPSSQPDVPSWQDKSPKPFRPSSSRLEDSLSGIPFNVHVHSLTVELAEDGLGKQGALFHNVTCGAPADHARGFANIVSTTNGTDGANVSPVGSVSGGLRRLEAKRVELAKAVQDAQSSLIAAVGRYIQVARQRSGGAPVHYIPALHSETSALRWKVFEATQALHHVTWTCAVRRASVFSQSLGIAITSYLTSVSDVGKQGWPDLWVRHGYLVTYEGLLSAAGKELGMIEDASVGIAMLRMVSVVLVPDAGVSSTTPERVAIPNSPFLKWVQLTPSGVGSSTRYRLEIGMDPQYYMERIPEPLKNGASVRLYPVLYQVGVDIRQWGAHQQMKVKDQLSASYSTETEEGGAFVGGLLEDEDDDVGVTDDDVLVSLNYEALRKMNAYAHLIAPVGPSTANGGANLLVTQSSNVTTQVHPRLTSLQEHIMSSAGRMNHSILDEAAFVAQSLGGGGAVFCKSGKDRTAMHVTYKQAQFARRYLSSQTAKGSSAMDMDQDLIYQDATLMRIYGTRLPICEKNVGQAKYAFNSLQVKFMPDMLKPPPNTLAGFLKGGRVFGGGGIES